jgi:tetratricopeptide (TPR) repeat protein
MIGKMNLVISISILLVVISSSSTITAVMATNGSSYYAGYITAHANLIPGNTPNANWYPFYSNDTCIIHPSSTPANGRVMPAVTNTTACQDGFWDGWKDWCSNPKYAVDCITNITSGNIPPMLLQAHHEYMKGYDAANGTGAAMCPIGENAVFCNGFNENNGDYGDSDCADTPMANITTDLVGCIGDNIPANQIGGLPALIGNWHFVNQSSTKPLEPAIKGTMLFNSNGYSRMVVPSKTVFGDYTLESSWAYIGTKNHILTLCYAGGCENATLTGVAPNSIDFIDNNNDTLHLTRLHNISAYKAQTTSLALASEIRNQNNVTIIYQNGLSAIDLKNYTGAQSLFQKALAINPRNVQVLSSMGQVLYYLANYTGATAVLDKALTIDPSYQHALEIKGILLYELGHFRESLASLDKALEFEPYPYYSTLENKGLALYRLGDYTESISALNSALKLNPDEHAFFNKGLVLATLGLKTHDVGDLNAALDNLNKTLRINPNYGDALSIKTLITQLLSPQTNGQ